MTQSPGRRAEDWAHLALVALSLLVTLAYAAGLFVVDAARIVGGFALVWGVALLLSPRFRSEHRRPELFAAWQQKLLVVLLLTLAGLLVAHLLLRIPLGEHGIDFAIFSQAVSGIGRTGVPTVTLVGFEPRNFLTHHFSPYLYVPGTLAALGLPPSVAGVLVHVAGLVLGLWALQGAFRVLGVPRPYALVLLTAAALSPAVRSAFAWTFNDELYGAPFVVVGLSLWLQGRHLGAALALVVACLCKESFSAVTVAFCFVALVWHTEFRPEEERRRALAVFVPLGLGALALFVGYFFLQPVLFAKSFDHADKLVRAEQLGDAAFLRSKALYVASLFGPTLGLPLLTHRGRILLLVALPGVGLSLVSGFPEMHQPLNYYAVTPVLVSFVALAASFPSIAGAVSPRVLQVGLVVMWMAALSFKSLPFARTVWRGVTEPWRTAAQLAWVSRERPAVVDPAAALFLLDHPRLFRLWGVSTSEKLPDFGVVVLRKPEGYESPSARLRRATSSCREQALWEVLCARERRAP